MNCTSRAHAQNMILTGSCPACGEGVREPSAADQDVARTAALVVAALSKSGGPLEEMVQRCRRMETRVTNLLRAIGMAPGCTIPDAQRGTAVYADGAVHVSSPDVSLADVAVAAVRGARGESGPIPVVLCNQPWGNLHITTKE